MKKLLIPFLIFAMLLSGCFLFGPSPKEVVSEAFDNLDLVDYYNYELSFGGEINKDGETMVFGTFFDGVQDNSDSEKPKFTMNVDGNFSADNAEDQNFKFEMSSDDDYLYFVLREISDFEDTFSIEAVEPYFDEWYKMDLQSEIFSSLLPFSTDEENATEQQKQFSELLDDTEFFKDYEYVSSEGGRDLYTTSLDKEAVKDFLAEAAEIQGQTMSEIDLVDLDEFLATIEFGMDMYVDEAENVLVMVDGFMTITNPSGYSANLDFGMDISDLHEPVVVEIPADAVEFDPMLLFSAVIMDMVVDPTIADPTMMTDPTMMVDPTIMEMPVIMDMPRVGY